MIRRYMTQCCSRSPVSGGKSLHGSKYCHHHSFLESSEDSAVVATTNMPSPHIANALLEKSKVGSLPRMTVPNYWLDARKVVK